MLRKVKRKGEREPKWFGFQASSQYYSINTFVLAQPLSPKVKYELICEKKWLVECMDEEWSESPWNEVVLKRDVGDAEWKCGFKHL